MKRDISTLHNWDKKLYDVWYRMRKVCSDRNHKDFKWYGAKGIRVDNEWLVDVNVFRKWAYSNGYAPGLTIDRVDSGGDYRPSNCRWVTIQENLGNRSNLITKNNIRKCEVCKLDKSLKEFHKNGDGRHYHCKICRSIERRIPNGYYARRERKTHGELAGFI